MDTLFPVTRVFPKGFLYIPEFLSELEEHSLLKEIRAIELNTFKFQGFEAKRRVASFGYDYSFDKKTLSAGQAIPPVFHNLIAMVGEKLAVAKEEFSELLITEYPIGSVINWHRDAFPFDLIAGISLLSDCTFKLRPQEKSRQTRSSILSFPVHRRSLYAMSGPARSEWQHSIAPVKSVRYSITLRTLRKTPGD